VRRDAVAVDRGSTPTAEVALDDLDRRILNRMQRDLPLCATPFAIVAAELGIDEDELLSRLAAMTQQRTISRVGPLYRVDGFGGGLALMAMSVPCERFDDVAATVNAFAEVAHNYEREHELNMWFVVAVETPTALAAMITAIESATGLKVYAFPKEREYFLELKLDV